MFVDRFYDPQAAFAKEKQAAKPLGSLGDIFPFCHC